MKAVEDGKCGVNQAALDHVVPKTTLKDRLNRCAVHGTNLGPRPYLDKDEELKLSQFIKRCTSIGYGRTQRDIMNIAQSLAVEKGVLQKSRISGGW